MMQIITADELSHDELREVIDRLRGELARRGPSYAPSSSPPPVPRSQVQFIRLLPAPSPPPTDSCPPSPSPFHSATPSPQSPTALPSSPALSGSASGLPPPQLVNAGISTLDRCHQCQKNSTYDKVQCCFCLAVYCQLCLEQRYVFQVTP
jgi:hypothetical protein